jgi:ADP-ribosylglycohydrolase
VTHAHAEGIAGAVAVAIAAAWAWRHGHGLEPAGTMLMRVLEFTPPSETRQGIEKAYTLPATLPAANAAARLGNGSRVIAPDTVPFALWCAARHLDAYDQAIWSAISVGGDIDTNCAIVGGIVAHSVGRDGIPTEWLQAREELV